MKSALPWIGRAGFMPAIRAMGRQSGIADIKSALPRVGFIPARKETGHTVVQQHFRGYQRCSRIDYADSGNVFAVTICVKPRRSAFVASRTNEQLISEMKNLQEEGFWGVYLFCIMPDHLHLVVSPGAQGLSEAIKRLKGRMATWWRLHGDGKPLWQKGYFDHRLRSEEGFDDKCQYVMQNPVRAGLVSDTETYPWMGNLGLR